MFREIKILEIYLILKTLQRRKSQEKTWCLSFLTKDLCMIFRVYFEGVVFYVGFLDLFLLIKGVDFSSL